MDNTINLYEGLLNHLQNHAPLTALAGSRVYSHTPQNTVFPYIFLNIESANQNTFEADDFTYTLTIQIFSKSSSPREALEIREVINDNLNRGENLINLNQGNITFIQTVEKQECFLKDDQETWEALMKLRIDVE